MIKSILGNKFYCRGGERMATSSITDNIVIRDPKQVEAFSDAVDPYCGTVKTGDLAGIYGYDVY